MAKKCFLAGGILILASVLSLVLGAAGWNPGGKRNPEAMQPSAPGQTRFYMQDKVNFFSGLTAAK